MNVFFDVIIVSYNAGEKLVKTLQSVLAQEGVAGSGGIDFRVVIKDGNSNDGSVARAREVLHTYPAHLQSRVQILTGFDAGIYDAMNLALDAVLGAAGHAKKQEHENARHLIYFINCGDTLASRDVLRRIADAVRAFEEKNADRNHLPCIFYGDVIEEKTKERVSSNPVMDDFACYRHVPCHQACFYDAALFYNERFDTTLAVRADYDHFLKSYFTYNAICKYVSLAVANYEGGGFSETAENKKRSAAEHRIVLRRYMSDEAIAKFDRRMKLTLQPLRTYLAENKTTAKWYNLARRALYRARKGNG